MFCQFLSWLRKDYRILNIIFFFFASYLIFDTFYTTLVLKPAYVTHEKRKISVDDLPEFVICPEIKQSLSAVKSRGYLGHGSYFRGDMEEGIKISWSGNNREDVQKLYDEISILKSINDCGNDSYMYLNGKASVQFDLTRALKPYHVCCKVIPPRASKYHPIDSFKFDIPNNGNHQIRYEIFMADRKTASVFDMHKRTLLLPIISKNYLVNYKVSIIVEEKLEDDPSYPCIDYKLEGEYAKCVEKEIITQNSFYLNCTPPWMTGNKNMWCKGENDIELKDDYMHFLDRIMSSAGNTGRCLVPCKLKRYKGKFIGLNKGENGLTIWFEDEVFVMKSAFTNDFMTVLSKVGGFIGISKDFLWIVILFISSLGVLLTHIKLMGKTVPLTNQTQ